MNDPNKVTAAKRNAKRVLLICTLLAIPASIYFIFFAMGDDNNVSGHGYAAHILGVILAFISAFFFMGITFFSARGGYDDQPNYKELVEKERERQSQEN